MRKTIDCFPVFVKAVSLVVPLLLASAHVLLAGPAEKALLRAALIGHSEGVEETLARGADIGSVTETGWTALMRAANQGHVETVRLLMDRGADVNAVCSSGNALTFAVWHGHAPVVELLLEQGSLMEPRRGLIPPVIDASCFGYLDIVEMLLDHGATPDTRDSIAGYGGDGSGGIKPESFIQVPLTGEEERALGKTAPLTDAQCAPTLQLLPEPVSFPATGARNSLGGATAMTWAAQNGHTAVVRLLLERGADPDLTGRYDNFPLYVAATGNHLDTARLLLESGADPDTMGSWLKGTALMRAAELGYREMVRLLLDYGADAGLQDSRGNTALTLAQEKGRAEVIELLEGAAAQ